MFSDLLVHRVEVFRRPRLEDDSGPKTDRLGQPLAVNPRQHEGEETLVHSYRCRITRGRGGLVMMERAIDTFEQIWTMYTEPGVDINEDDAVRVIDPTTGNVLIPHAKLKVKSAATGRLATHHLEFMVWAQSGPGPFAGGDV